MNQTDNKALRRLVIFYALWTPLLLLFMLWILWGRGSSSDADKEVPAKEPEYIYVYAEPETNSEDTAATESTWIVREHDERIGIFTEDGVLLRVVDVYTKTLPKADRILLREGIAVTSRQDLYALMEDFGA